MNWGQNQRASIGQIEVVEFENVVKGRPDFAAAEESPVQVHDG